MESIMIEKKIIYHAITFIIFLLCPLAQINANGQNLSSKELLQRAVDYFQSEKYHEAGLILTQLDKQYKLNPRHRAFLAYCMYTEKEYNKCVAIFDSIASQLGPYSPQERSVYVLAAAQSHFILGHYDKAQLYYDSHLSLCHDNERGETLYKIGLCQMFQADYANAYDSFISSLAYLYRTPTRIRPDARIHEIEHLAAGCKNKIEKQSIMK